MPPATTHHPPPHPFPPTGVIRRRPELNTKQRAGFRRLLTSTAITINQHNPKSGASYERYDGYRFATVIGDFLAKSPSNSKGWMDLLNDGRRGIITIDDNAFIKLLPKPVCSALSCMNEIQLYGIFGIPQRMPLPSLTNFPIPRTDWSYSSQSRLIHKDMGSYLSFNIFMSSTGVALLPQTKRADFKCT